MEKVFKRILRILVSCVGFAFVLTVIAEVSHHHRYGHFVGYGLHIDVILGDSAVGTNDTYYAVLRNLSVHKFRIEGCRLPGGYAGSGVLYTWDVQRFNSSRGDWDSLRGANNWVPNPFAWEQWEGCRGEVTRLSPFSSRVTAWVFNGWVRNGDTVRMAIHTSVDLPPEKQVIVYTPTFTVGR